MEPTGSTVNVSVSMERDTVVKPSRGLSSRKWPKLLQARLQNSMALQRFRFQTDHFMVVLYTYCVRSIRERNDLFETLTREDRPI